MLVNKRKESPEPNPERVPSWVTKPITSTDCDNGYPIVLFKEGNYMEFSPSNLESALNAGWTRENLFAKPLWRKVTVTGFSDEQLNEMDAEDLMRLGYATVEDFMKV